MGRSPSITVGDADEGVRVEHVKSRGLVRLTRWSGRTVQDDAVGMDVSDFCARLGITTDLLGTNPPRYLLVGDPARPGARHVLVLFAAEQDARDQFVRFRRSEQDPDAWAELSEITTGSDLRRICWFGPTASSGRGDTPEPMVLNPKRRFGVRRRLAKRARP